MNPNEIFADMLVGEEAITATAGAPGATLPDGAQVWWQLALTPYRLLVARLVQRPKGWVVEARHAATRQAVKIAQFPRTNTSQARLEVGGFSESVVLLDVDRVDVHPFITGFLTAWGQPVIGVAALPTFTPKVEAEGSDVDTKKLLILAAVCFALLVMCCGCGGFLVVARDYLVPMIAGVATA